MDTKPIRIYTEHYEFLAEIKRQLREKWHREATFADAVRIIVSQYRGIKSDEIR